MAEPEHATSRACYLRGCRVDGCVEAYRVYARDWDRRNRASRPDTRTRRLAETDTDALNCACGGLLAEDDGGRIFCLSCDPVAVVA